MVEEIIITIEKQLDKQEWEQLKSKTWHLGIFTEPYLNYMLEKKKTIESRFSKNKIAPFEKITKDDIVFVKKSGGDIVAYFTIKEVLFFDLRNTPIEEIKEKYGKELCVDNSFWTIKKDSNYATLIVIDQIKKVKPFSIKKKGMQTWIELK